MSKLEDLEKITTLDQVEHVLLRPDPYVGIMSKTKVMHTIYENGEMIRKEMCYSPALMKIVDEIINNATDQKIRVKLAIDSNPEDQVTIISIKVVNGEISVFNNGRGFSIVKDVETGKYKPELALTKLNTGSNFEDDKVRYGAGRNGFGAALTTIFSKKMTIKTVWGKTMYTQVIENNSTVISDPVIESTDMPQYTSISFVPDYVRFNTDISEIEPLIRTRAIELATFFNKDKLKVYYNSELVKINSFESYLAKISQNPVVFTSAPMEGNDDITPWKIAFWRSEKQVKYAYVNGINTYDGGSHITCLYSELVQRLKKYLPSGITIGAKSTFSYDYVKKLFSLYVVCYLPNPSFDSQTKSKLGSEVKCPSIPEEFFEELFKKSDIIEFLKKNKPRIVNLENEGTKKLKMFIDSYDPANNCESEPEKCTLMIAEGNSGASGLKNAKLALGKVGTDYYGVLPLRGKILNPKKCSLETQDKNKVLMSFKKVMGLNGSIHYHTFNDRKNLRYHTILICTDQDYDGFHIAGLILNYIHSNWPELLLVKGFIKIFRTPLIKLTIKNQIIPFYSIPEYQKYIELNDIKKPSFSYFKGLAGHTNDDYIEFFKNLSKNTIHVTYGSLTETVDDASRKFHDVFGKDVNRRKQWILSGKNTTIEGYSTDVTTSGYLDNNVRPHAIYNTRRCIPSLMDGLKPGQRKILATMLKLPESKEYKVTEIVGKVTETMDYHHGDSSLADTITTLAKNFIGHNLVNLLEPIGQFGSRVDPVAGSARYLKTKLTVFGKYLFSRLSKNLLTYEDELYEPTCYYPPVPLVAINGAEGIGTGWSTRIYCHNPNQVCSYITAKIKGLEPPKVEVYYHNFSGSIINENDGFIMKGCYSLEQNILFVTELPVWINLTYYKNLLSKYYSAGYLKSNPKFDAFDAEKTKTYTKFRFTIVLSDQYMQKMKKTGEIEKVEDVIKDESKKDLKENEKEDEIHMTYDIVRDFRLKLKCSYKNMHLFDDKGELQHYNTIYAVLDSFYSTTDEMYKKKYDYDLKILKEDLAIVSSKYLFVKGVLEKKITVIEKTYSEIENDIVNYSSSIIRVNDSFEYLIKMSIKKLTVEGYDELKKEEADTIEKIKIYEETLYSKFWLDDIMEFWKIFQKKLST